MPVALLLIKRNATVTVCHSATQNMEQVVREADIVIAAAGQPEMIKVGDQFEVCSCMQDSDTVHWVSHTAVKGSQGQMKGLCELGR